MCFCGRYLLEEGPPVHISATSIVVKAKDYHAVSIADAYKQVGLSTTDGLLDYSGFIHALSILTSAPLALTEHEFMTNVCSDGKLSNFNDFANYCTLTFGDLSAVVIKFMSSKSQYKQELQQHELRRDGSRYVVRILLHSESEELKGRWGD